MLLIILAFPLILSISNLQTIHSFPIKEATIQQLQSAILHNHLTSKQLVEFYLSEITNLNPLLKGVIEVNPDAVSQAIKADEERETNMSGSLPVLHGIPILIKGNIATEDKLNTTAGSYALLGSVVRRDAGMVAKLRRAGAIILGKASLSEWAHVRSFSAPSGWCARSGQGKNPYDLSNDTCGSSSGSAISVAANMAAVSLGTETSGSILCPSSFNAVVGIKPTVGLTSRAGVVPISPRQDTVGPMCRTVSDAVYVLDAIVGFDPRDAKATARASKEQSWALKMFTVSKNQKVRKTAKWSVIKVPKQPDAFQCGYYVMKYMQEIIHSDAIGTIDELQSLFKERKYCIEDIDDVRTEWAEVVQDYMYP